jgi:hypothetical protein
MTIKSLTLNILIYRDYYYNAFSSSSKHGQLAKALSASVVKQPMIEFEENQVDEVDSGEGISQ